MAGKRKPSYFDDDYDERISKRSFTFKSFLQLIAYFIIVIFKALRDFAVNFHKKHPLDEIVRNSRRRHRLTFVLILVSIFIFSIMIGTVMLAVNKENKRISKFNADAGKVCADYIKEYGTPNYENMYSAYGIAGYRMTGLCYARELDFDNNGTSELFICYNDSGVYEAEVWGYVGKDFKQLCHCKLAQTKRKTDDVWQTLYHHNNKYYIGVHDEKDLSKVSLFGLRGDEFAKRYEATYDQQSETFAIRKKVDYTSFERIKLSILREEKASVILTTISNTIEGFKMDATKPAESNKKVTAKTAYAEIVSDYQQKHGTPSLKTEDGIAYIDGLAFVKLIDLNNDGTNELIVSYRNATKVRDEDNNGDYISIIEYKYSTEVYTFKNKKAKLIFERNDASQKQSDEADKYLIIQNDKEHSNLCFNNYSSTQNGHVVTATSTILQYDGKTVEPIYKSKFITDYGYKEYFINDEEVWRGKFEEQGYRVPFFDDSSIYSETEFDVFYLQRSAGNSASVQTQLDSTMATIGKLVK